MFMYRKLMTGCAVAVLGLGLAACGSSSDNGEKDDLRTENSDLQEKLDTANATIMDLQGQVAALNTTIGDEMDPDAESLRGMLAQKDADLEQARADLLAAMDNSADETTIAGLRQDVMDAEGERDGYKTMLDQAILDRDMYKQMVADIEAENTARMAEDAKKDRVARANRILTSLSDPNVEGVNRVGTSVTATPTGVNTVTAKRDAAGMVTVTTDNDDYTGGENPADSSGWTGTMLSKTDAVAETQDILVIYTDIEAPKDKPFIDLYERPDRDDILSSVARLEMAQSASFPTGNSQSLDFGGDSGNSGSFAGSFDGVSGTYECTAQEACMLMTDADGDLEVSEGWRFTPNSNLATVKDPDAAYTYFGWWLKKPDDNTMAHDVEVFAGGTATAAQVMNEVVGNVSYSGPAAGKYATRTFTAGFESDGGAGHFTATANLTAKFGAADVPGTIGGSVSGFVLDDTTSAGWKVTLEDTAINGALFNGTSEVDFGGGATETDAGTWNGSFYGAGTDDDDAPSTAVGTFDALTDNASVIGAFGVTKQ